MMNSLKPAYLLRKSVHNVVHRLQSRNIDCKDIKPDYPATILSIFFKVTFSGFDYLLLLVQIQLMCQHFEVAMGQIFYFTEYQCFAFFRDYVHFSRSVSEIPFNYGISQGFQKLYGLVLPLSALDVSTFCGNLFFILRR